MLWDGAVPDAAPSKRTLSPEDLSQQLDRLLLEDMASDEQIFDWVEVRRDRSRWCRRWGGGGGSPESPQVSVSNVQANLDESQMSSAPFLRALMTAVCKAAVKGERGRGTSSPSLQQRWTGDASHSSSVSQTTTATVAWTRPSSSRGSPSCSST